MRPICVEPEHISLFCDRCGNLTDVLQCPKCDKPATVVVYISYWSEAGDLVRSYSNYYRGTETKVMSLLQIAGTPDVPYATFIMGTLDAKEGFAWDFRRKQLIGYKTKTVFVPEL